MPEEIQPPKAETSVEKKPAKKTCCSINKEFVAYKAHYFLLNGAHVGVIPYLPVYAKTILGCSATTFGLLATAVQFSTTVSKPVFGLLADCLNQMRLLIATLLCLEVLLNLLMLMLPPVPVAPAQGLHRHLPASDATHVLRFAPARLYDAGVGMHVQPRKFSNTRRESGTSFLDTSMLNHSDLSYTTRKTRGKKQSKKGLTALDSPKQDRCTLKCDVLISEAQCYQEEKHCVHPEDKVEIDCLLRKASGPFCDELLEGSRFSLIYEVQNISSATTMEMIPESVRYYPSSFFGGETQICNFTNASCSLNCTTERFCLQTTATNRSIYQTYQFWAFSLFAVIGSMCQGAMYTLSDTVCYEKIRGTKTDFGRQRLWGAIGWGAIAPVTGLLNDLASDGTIHEDYSSGWYIMAIFTVFLLLNLLCMNFPEPTSSSSMWSDVRRVVSSRLFVLMELNVFFLGIFNAYASNYVIWYMESLGSSRIAMGLALAMECLCGEAPFMYFSGWIIEKLGHWHIMTLTSAAFAARFVAYYFITNPWIILPVELLNGVTFGLFYTTMTSFGEHVAPLGTEATIQGILGGTYLGLGSGVGCLVAGLSFDRFGGRLSFLFAGLFSLGLTVMQALLGLVCRPNDEEGAQKLEEGTP